MLVVLNFQPARHDIVIDSPAGVTDLKDIDSGATITVEGRLTLTLTGYGYAIYEIIG
jgi:hypothetical protein